MTAQSKAFLYMRHRWLFLLAMIVTLIGTGCNAVSTGEPIATSDRLTVLTTSGAPKTSVSDTPTMSNAGTPTASGTTVTTLYGTIASAGEVKPVRIRLAVGANQAIAVLDDSKTARDFLSMLPLTLRMSDYNQIEKVAELPRKLTLEGAPAGHDPCLGEIASYTPWGNFIVYFRDFGYSAGLVRLGKIESGLELFTSQPGEFEVTISIAQ